MRLRGSQPRWWWAGCRCGCGCCCDGVWGVRIGCRWNIKQGEHDVSRGFTHAEPEFSSFPPLPCSFSHLSCLPRHRLRTPDWLVLLHISLSLLHSSWLRTNHPLLLLQLPITCGDCRHIRDQCAWPSSNFIYPVTIITPCLFRMNINGMTLRRVIKIGILA